VGFEKGKPKKHSAESRGNRNLNHYYDLVHFALATAQIEQRQHRQHQSKTALTGQGNTSAYRCIKGAILPSPWSGAWAFSPNQKSASMR